MSLGDTPDKFYDQIDLVVDTKFTEQPTFEFDFRATGIMVVVDSLGSGLVGPLEFSFNGKDRHGRIYQFDKFVVFDWIDDSKIWLRAPDTICRARVWAWRKMQ